MVDRMTLEVLKVTGNLLCQFMLDQKMMERGEVKPSRSSEMIFHYNLMKSLTFSPLPST